MYYFDSSLFCLVFIFYFVHRLQAVSTNVGGVFEVLPSDMLYLADPSVQGIMSFSDYLQRFTWENIPFYLTL